MHAHTHTQTHTQRDRNSATLNTPLIKDSTNPSDIPEATYNHNTDTKTSVYPQTPCPVRCIRATSSGHTLYINTFVCYQTFYVPYLGEYVSALKQIPDDPLLNLTTGITYFHLASQKFAARRNSLIIQVKV